MTEDWGGGLHVLKNGEMDGKTQQCEITHCFSANKVYNPDSQGFCDEDTNAKM